MNKWCVYVVLAGCVMLAGNTHAAGNADAGKAKSASCAGCHGQSGISMNPEWPNLAGQNGPYLVKQLEDFKSGARQNATMQPMVAALSRTDMEDVAAWFAGLESRTGTADPALVELGERIYRGGNKETGLSACTSCHGPSGAGNPAAGFPSVNGQHSSYAVAQLKAFRDGQRANDKAGMMRDIAARMTEKEMQAVASYMQGLH